MKLFNEKKNLFFGITHKLLNKSQNGIDFEEMIEAFDESGFTDYNYEFVSALIGKKNSKFSDVKLFEKRGDKYFSIVNCKVPVMLSAIEKEWINKMQSSEEVKDFLSNTNINKILEAMRANKIIVCTNETIYGDKYTEARVIPYKLEYSQRMKAFWLICYNTANRVVVKMAVERMTITDLIDNNLNVDLEQLFEIQRAKDSIVLEIKDEKGALERALHTFSSYRKDGVFDKAQNLHIIKIYYYNFDEYELVKDIISLGSYVKVIEPQVIQRKIIDKVNRQIRMFA